MPKGRRFVIAEKAEGKQKKKKNFNSQSFMVPREEKTGASEAVHIFLLVLDTAS